MSGCGWIWAKSPDILCCCFFLFVVTFVFFNHGFDRNFGVLSYKENFPRVTHSLVINYRSVAGSKQLFGSVFCIQSHNTKPDSSKICCISRWSLLKIIRFQGCLERPDWLVKLVKRGKTLSKAKCTHNGLWYLWEFPGNGQVSPKEQGN